MPPSYYGSRPHPYQAWMPPAHVPAPAHSLPEASSGLINFLNRYYDRFQSMVGGRLLGESAPGTPADVMSSGSPPRDLTQENGALTNTAGFGPTTASKSGGLLDQFAPSQKSVKLIDDGFGNLLDEPTAKLISDIAHGTPDQTEDLHRRVEDRFGADRRSAYFFHAAVNDMDAGYTPEEQQKYLGPVGDYRFRNDYMIFDALVGGALATSTLPRATSAPKEMGLGARSHARDSVAEEFSRVPGGGTADAPSGTTPPARVATAEVQATAASTVPKNRNATRYGVERHPREDWKMFQDLWDQTGYGDILSSRNRSFIAQERSPIVDEQWVRYFPEDAGLVGQVIHIHHIDGSVLRLPWPRRRHYDAHIPGGTKWNPGGPGSAAPSYFDSPKRKR